LAVELREEMKVLGGRLAPYWERFDRMQRTASLLLGARLGPKGLQRFKTYEEFEAWKMSHRLKPRDYPSRTTSSGSVGN
jgi:hypothetical protein